MRNEIDIKEPYKRVILPFKSGIKYVYMPKLSATIKDPITGEVSKTAHPFLVDTGASISIINARFESFINRLEPVDRIKIQYGSGKKNLNIYDIIIIIKGIEIQAKVAYDELLSISLLGHYSMFENLTYQLFDASKMNARLIKVRR